MNDKNYFTLSAIIFSVIAIAHLGRVMLMLPANVAGYDVPLWFSGAAVVISGYLAVRGLQAAWRL